MRGPGFRVYGLRVVSAGCRVQGTLFSVMVLAGRFRGLQSKVQGVEYGMRNASVCGFKQ